MLTYGTDVNAQLLQRGASEQLVSGCTALLNVMALFAPVPFFSIGNYLGYLEIHTLIFDFFARTNLYERRAGFYKLGEALEFDRFCSLATQPQFSRFFAGSQLEMLTDAAFLLVEYVSGCGADEQVAVCNTLLRLCKSICTLSKQEYSEVRQILQELYLFDRSSNNNLDLLAVLTTEASGWAGAVLGVSSGTASGSLRSGSSLDAVWTNGSCSSMRSHGSGGSRSSADSR